VKPLKWYYLVGLIIAIFLLISMQTMYLYALELPPELVAKLHTSLRIAFLYDTHYSWEPYSQASLLPIKYYQIVKIDTNGLYGINA
jgi:hypothetical protein